MSERENASNLQAQPLAANADWQRLQQQRAYLERQLAERVQLEQQLRELYGCLAACASPEDLQEQLERCRGLLARIFTAEGRAKRLPLQTSLLELDWERYGIDIAAYVAAEESLVAQCPPGSLD